ncbi:sugar phosphate isomerase/epimerase family protein [Tepidimicrobium xylanilyticum]|uniref:sugar phosphate isomerase/epimerase family protein n=1 Tax=Tepidimicrobium xylanilyticum TaxID=1123352 RepID=UPI0026515752|nr:TIM barrel protein [Tepidimicrobium xylanilyticum]GMG95894.1 hypothetical protein EN5CB1_07200 [Tepidimicrobium xylanilyticum]
MSNIINCISHIKDFNREKYIQLNLGLEIQDFVNPNLLEMGWDERVDEYKKALEGFPNTLSLHGPFLDLKPVSLDPKIKEASYNRYLQALNIGKKLNVDYIIFHSQINPWIKEPKIVEMTNNLNREFWNKILEEVEDFNGMVLIENVFEFDPLMIKELVDIINLPNVKICFDIGHALLESKVELEDWIKILNDMIEYIHLHWNNGIYDEHNRPTRENILLIKELLNKYNLNPKIALEYGISDVEDEIKRLI